MIQVSVEPHFESFRQRCRELLASGIPPQEVIWSEANAAQLSLLAESATAPSRAPKLNVPRRFFDLARLVSAHRDSSKWHLLYSVLWRIGHGERNLLALQVDPEVIRLTHMRQAIARDIHHMHALVRFRRLERDGNEWFVAWYRPDHRIVRLAAPFFAERFAAMRWSILTPDESAHWDGTRLQFLPGAPQSEAPDEDALEALWATYYGTTFNPARMNLDLMRQELPQRFWSNLPELRNLPEVLSSVPERLEVMQRQQANSARSVIPQTSDLRVLQQAAMACTACPLHCNATQTVFGEGPANAQIVLVGEQPGDAEDLSGRPFVGPAGEVLDRALAEAGIPRTQVYLTNAVKHFKHVREGKRRIHQAPRMPEIVACKPWLEAELASIRPTVIVLLGATAAKALLGNSVRVTRDAGKVFRSPHAVHTIVSVHPSFVLRSPDPEASESIFNQLVADLRTARHVLVPEPVTVNR